MLVTLRVKGLEIKVSSHTWAIVPVFFFLVSFGMFSQKCSSVTGVTFLVFVTQETLP